MNRLQQVKLILKSVSQWNEYRKNNPGFRVDLSHADLTGANLRVAILTGADLSHADLTGAKLTGANLRDANLNGAILNRANLNGANLTRSELHSSELLDANLRNANLHDADLTGAILGHADLAGANLLDANLHGAMLNRAMLIGANLTRAKLIGATLSDASLLGADLSGADLTRADLSGADLTRADLLDTLFENTVAKSEYSEIIVTVLSETKNLTQYQLENMLGDSDTLIPEHLTRPTSWPEYAKDKKVEIESSFTQDEPDLLMDAMAQSPFSESGDFSSNLLKSFSTNTEKPFIFIVHNGFVYAQVIALKLNGLFRKSGLIFYHYDGDRIITLANPENPEDTDLVEVNYQPHLLERDYLSKAKLIISIYSQGPGVGSHFLEAANVTDMKDNGLTIVSRYEDNLSTYIIDNHFEIGLAHKNEETEYQLVVDEINNRFNINTNKSEITVTQEGSDSSGVADILADDVVENSSKIVKDEKHTNDLKDDPFSWQNLNKFSPDNRNFVYLSFDSTDIDKANYIVTRLLEHDIFTVSNRSISALQMINESPDTALANSAAIVTLWSNHSARSSNVLQESSFGLASNKLINASLEKNQIPTKYKVVSTINFSGLHIDGDTTVSDRESFDQIVSQIKEFFTFAEVAKSAPLLIDDDMPPGFEKHDLSLKPISQKLRVNSTLVNDIVDEAISGSKIKNGKISSEDKPFNTLPVKNDHEEKKEILHGLIEEGKTISRILTKTKTNVSISANENIKKIIRAYKAETTKWFPIKYALQSIENLLEEEDKNSFPPGTYAQITDLINNTRTDLLPHVQHKQIQRIKTKEINLETAYITSPLIDDITIKANKILNDKNIEKTFETSSIGELQSNLDLIENAIKTHAFTEEKIDRKGKNLNTGFKRLIAYLKSAVDTIDEGLRKNKIKDKAVSAGFSVVLKELLISILKLFT